MKSLVHGHQGRRAGCIHHQGRSSEIERIGNPACCCCEYVAGEIIGALYLFRPEPLKRVIVVGEGYIDAHPLASVLLDIDICILKCPPDQFKEDPVLWVHGLGFLEAYVEKSRIKLINGINKSTADRGYFLEGQIQ